MKNLKLIMALVLSACMVTFLSQCTEESLDNQEVELGVDLSIPEDMGGMKWGNYTLPQGTTSQLSTDGSKLELKLPEGVVYIAEHNDELFSVIDDGYTCSSTCTGGCNVVKFGETVGCESCPEGSKEACTGQETSIGGIGIGGGTGGGFVDLKTGISFVKKGDEMPKNKLQSPDWEVLMRHPQIAKEFEVFYNSILGKTAIDYKNSSLILTNIYGTYVRLYVPNDYKNARLRDDYIEGNGVSCGCSSGGSGCTHEDITTGRLVKLKVGDRCVAGDCESCSMSW